MGDVKLTEHANINNSVGYGYRVSEQVTIQSAMRAGEKDASELARISDIQRGMVNFFNKYKSEIKSSMLGSAVFKDVPSMLQLHKVWEEGRVTYIGYGTSFQPSDDLRYSIRLRDENDDGMIDRMTIVEKARYHFVERRGLFRKAEYTLSAERVVYHLTGLDFQPFFSALLTVGLAE